MAETFIDVVIIGSGYTGLAAARETALAGRSTLVLDAGEIGGGCSSRNGGQVAFSFKPAHGTLVDRHGRAIADGIYREGVEAVDELRRLAVEEGLDCGWRESGCFVAATTTSLVPATTSARTGRVGRLSMGAVAFASRRVIATMAGERACWRSSS